MVGIRLFSKREPSVLFYKASRVTKSAYKSCWWQLSYCGLHVRAVSVFGKKSYAFCGFWRIFVQFCGFRIPLTPPHLKKNPFVKSHQMSQKPVTQFTKDCMTYDSQGDCMSLKSLKSQKDCLWPKPQKDSLSLKTQIDCLSLKWQKDCHSLKS